MIKVYETKSVSDIISLAQEVQTQVYWNNSFYLEDSEIKYPWKEFWDIMEEFLVSRGSCSQVVINHEFNMVELVK